jgi:transcriptional regulator with XRE-family HTH domain
MLRYQNISKTRNKLGLSQSDLSKITGIRVDMLSRIENGKQVNPTLRTMELLAHALQIPVAELIDESIITD